MKSESVILWLMGYPAAGKTTLSNCLFQILRDRGVFVIQLDGDHLRKTLNQDLGFSLRDREENLRRIAEVAKLLFQQGTTVIVSAITPTCALQEGIRQIFLGLPLHLVYLRCELDLCIQRDPKGNYQKAIAGEILEFTGISSLFEEPKNPDLILDTGLFNVEECTTKLCDYVYSNKT